MQLNSDRDFVDFILTTVKIMYNIDVQEDTQKKSSLFFIIWLLNG